jgi:beta-phosphoglucomutase-like phosphatase (HAD superfamily)
MRAVVLDFDGVIADTERLHFAAFRDVFGARGWVLEEAAYFHRYLGCDDYGLVRDFTRDHGIEVSDEDVDTLVSAKGARFGRHLSSADILFAGAKASIEALAARFPLGIASGALHHEIAAILRQAGVLDCFRVIVAADDVTATKPAPEPYLAAAAGLGISPSFCVAVEDSVPGLEAARAAGMRTIAVTTTSPARALSGADRIVAGLHEVSPALVAELVGGRSTL